MGYGYYELPDGRLAGYTVEAVCDYSGCKVEIDRGFDYLCGEWPNGHRSEDQPGCGDYFCARHQNYREHECTNAPCNVFPSIYEQAYECDLLPGHPLPHKDADGQTFTKTEDEDE